MKQLIALSMKYSLITRFFCDTGRFFSFFWLFEFLRHNKETGLIRRNSNYKDSKYKSFKPRRRLLKRIGGEPKTWDRVSLWKPVFHYENQFFIMKTSFETREWGKAVLWISIFLLRNIILFSFYLFSIFLIA